jgi:hypothetical protein
MTRQTGSRRWSSITTILVAATAVAVAVSTTPPLENEALAKKPSKKSKPAASASASTSSSATATPPGAPRGQVGRKPTSGSCDNADNKCSGNGESCIDNLCYCTQSGWARCSTDPDDRNCSYIVSDMDNCGTCGHRCKDSQMCEKGKCVAVKCDPGETSCRVGCRDLKSADDSCGSCDHYCKTDLGYHCVDGRCR